VIRRLVFAAVLVAGLAGSIGPSGAASGGTVQIVPIEGTIDEGMAHMVARAVREAPERHLRAIVLDVNTFGGLVSAGTEIRDAVDASSVPVYAYVSQRAWSAGALVTLAATKIAMAPGSSIGAAEPIPTSPKSVSALRGEFESTAARNHRNPTIAGAMVDAGLNAPQYKAPGAILTLTADDAQRAHFVDTVAPTLSAALTGFGLAGAATEPAQYTFGEEVARFATNPDVSGLLLTIGFLGLLIEMQTLHGIGGLVWLGVYFHRDPSVVDRDRTDRHLLHARDPGLSGKRIRGALCFRRRTRRRLRRQRRASRAAGSRWNRGVVSAARGRSDDRRPAHRRADRRRIRDGGDRNSGDAGRGRTHLRAPGGGLRDARARPQR
jgi:hypothetical protein